jgi:formylmethanofuran dehydrogenase subunit E-like metal-binding protein
LKRTVAEIKRIVESAEEITLQESDGWFDKITVNRHMKQLKEAYKVLEKTCNELVTSQQRFESAYNDIGRVLENYYDV